MPQMYRTAITVTSLTKSDIAPNLDTGHIRKTDDGKEYILMKVDTGSITDGSPVRKADSSDTEFIAKVSTVIGQKCAGVNNTGGLIAANTYFWALKSGIGYASPDGAGWSGGDIIVTSATTTTCAGFANTEANAKLHPNIIGTAINDDAAVPDGLVMFSL